jgi:hypothetical protein
MECRSATTPWHTSRLPFRSSTTEAIIDPTTANRARNRQLSQVIAYGDFWRIAPRFGETRDGLAYRV